MVDTDVASLRAHLAAIVDSSDDAIISKNLQGVISTWNHGAERLFGYSEEEAVGQPITIIIPDDLLDEEKEILGRLRTGVRVEHFETRRVTRDRRILDVSLTISPVRDTTGAIVGASKIVRDITASKQAHTALLASERRLAREAAAARTLQAISTGLISESSEPSLFVQILDAAMALMQSDCASLQMLAPDQQSLTLLGWRHFHPDSAAFWHHVTADAGSTCGVALRDNVRVLVTDVDSCEFMAGTQDLEEYRRSDIRAVQSTPLRSRLGSPLGMISTHWRAPHQPTEEDFRLFDVLARQAADLIERIRTEEALRESEERFRLIANNAPVIIWMCDTSRRSTYVNQMGLDLTGEGRAGDLVAPWTAAVHPDDASQCRGTRVAAFDRREPFRMDYRVRRVDGEYRWILCDGAPRYHADGSFAGYIGSGLDVTERKRALLALAAVSRQVIEAQEAERSRIARELHDDLGQRLTVVCMELDALSQTRTGAGDRPQIEAAREELRNLLKDMQALSHSLHPARIEYLGIGGAAAALCREVANQFAAEITFSTDGAPEQSSQGVAVCLYRVLQEALQNAIKHGGGRKIDVTLRSEADRLVLTVRDFGAGFDVSARQGRGLGLISMQERLAAVGGQLTVLSAPHHGTTVLASAPLAADDSPTPDEARAV